jgi:hypothetical protein
MTKEKTGLPRFLFCTNMGVNDNEYILHTARPEMLLKVVKDGAEIKTTAVRLYDEANKEQIEMIEREALKKYLFGRRKED